MIDMTRIRAAFGDFKKEEDGTASVELVFMVPGLALLLFALITFFAGFRAQTHATRAATVVTDMVSREVSAVTPAFFEGVDGIMKTMVQSDANPDFRITAFIYDEDEDAFSVSWSKNNGELGNLDSEGLNAVSDRLPTLKDGQRAFLVETGVDYEPIFNIGIGTQRFENFNVAAPRFVAQLCYMDDLNADPQTAQC